jgi:RHS repeat-associated protein
VCHRRRNNFIVSASATDDNSSLPELRLYYLDELMSWRVTPFQVAEHFFERSGYSWVAFTGSSDQLRNTLSPTSKGTKALELYAGETFVLLQAVGSVAESQSFEVYRHFIYRWPEDYSSLKLDLELCLDISKGVEWDCIKRHNSEVVIRKDEDSLVLPSIVGDQIIIDVWEKIGPIDRLTWKAKQKKFVYQYSGLGWYEEIFDNDQLQNNYLGQNSFSTTEDGRAQYREFNPSKHGWQTGMPAYRDGNPFLFEKLVWPIISLVGGLAILPLDIGAGLLVDILFLNVDALIEAMTKLGGAGQGTDQFFSADFSFNDRRQSNLVYHRSSTGLWAPIGDLTPDAYVGTDTGKKSGLAKVFEDLKLDHASTRFVENAIVCGLEREQYASYTWMPVTQRGKATQPYFPKYKSRVQLFKNGVFFKTINLPEKSVSAPGELVRHTVGATSLSGINAFFTFKCPLIIEDPAVWRPSDPRFEESLKKAIGLKLYRVINDDIQGALTDFVVSRVTVNDGYSDTHTHYDYDTATASIAQTGAGALYGKVTTIYSGASAEPDKSNGFTESLFHSDESMLYKGLLYQTRIFNQQGVEVATNISRWKGFMKKLTPDGIERSRTGYFVRSVATVSMIDGVTKRNEIEYCTGEVYKFELDPSGSLPFAIPAFVEIRGEGWHIDGKARLKHSSRGISSNGAEPWQSEISPLIIDSKLYGSLQFRYEFTTDIDAHGTATFEAWVNAAGSKIWSEDCLVIKGEGGFTGSASLNVGFDDGPVEFRVSCRLYGSNMNVDFTIYDIGVRTTAIGTPVEVRNLHYDITGKPIKTIEAFTYGWQKYPALLAPNVLTPVVETRTLVNEIVTGASATTWGPASTAGNTDAVPHWVPHVTYQAKHSTGPFGSAQPANSPDWLATSTILARSAQYGVVTESQDVDGIVHSVLYDKLYRFPVATFINASIERREAGHYGFEDYEQSEPWQIGGNLCRVVNTGSVALSGSPARIEPKHFVPRSGQTPYVVSAWVSLTSLASSGQIGFGNKSTTISAANGGWQYVEFITESPSETEKPFISCDGFIDDFRFGPVDALFTATVYDSEHHRVTAQLDTNGAVLRTVYDDLQLPLATLGPDGRVLNLHSECFSRQGIMPFNSGRPNQKLTILPKMGGRYYPRFAEYAARVNDQETADSINGTNQGLRFELIRSAQGSPNAQSGFVVRFGAAAAVTGSVAWDASSSSGSLVLSWSEATPGNPPPVITEPAVKISAGCTFLLLLIDSHVYCFIDGTLTAHRALTTAPVAGLSLDWNPEGNAELVNLLTFNDPMVSISFTDGLGRVIQTQQLADHGAEAIAVQTLYDGWGHAAVQTKPVPVSPGLAYQDDLVSSFDWQYNAMNGRVVDYYGRSENRAVGQLARDHKYSFVWQVAEHGPLARVIESGGPGAEFKPRTPYVLKQSFGQSDHAKQLLQDLGLSTISQHYMALTTSRETLNGAQTAVQIFDSQGELIASRRGSGASALTSSYGVQFKGDETVASSRLPNAFSVDGSQAMERYINKSVTDFRGLLKQSSDCDRGTQHHVYDPAGRLRFRLDAAGAVEQPNRILYWRYDALGRVIEEGQLLSEWSDERLQAQADSDPAWPDSSAAMSSNQTSWRKRYFYDISPSSGANLKGRLSRVLSRDETGEQTEEAYQYDPYGRVSAVSLRVPAFDDLTRTTTYRYDTQGNIVEIGYPTGLPGTVPIASVHYTYTNGGRLAGVGTADDPTFYAAYDYNIDGSVKTEWLNRRKNRRVYSYDFQGRLHAIQDYSGFFAEALGYRDTGGRFKDGNIGHVVFDGSALERHTYFYEYDEHGRLRSAKFSLTPPATLPGNWDVEGINGNPISYDANGNIITITKSGTAQEYFYEAGTNRLVGTSQPRRTTVFSFEPNEVTDSATGSPGRLGPWKPNPAEFQENEWYVKSPFQLTHKEKHSGTQSLQLGELLGSRLRASAPASRYVFRAWIKNLQPDTSKRLVMSIWTTADKPLVQKLIPPTNGEWQLFECVVENMDLPPDTILEALLVRAVEIESPMYVDDVFFGIEPADYRYDASGRVISNRHLRRLEYEPLTGLTREIEAESQSGFTKQTSTVKLRYGAQGQRVLKTAVSKDSSVSSTGRQTTDTTRKMLYLHGTNAYPLCEASTARYFTITEASRSGMGSQQIGSAAYVYGIGGLIAMHEGEQTYFFCKDHLGSPRVVLDQDNRVCAGFYYQPFGELIIPNSDSVRKFHYLYTGQEFDWETGLYNYRARMYDPQLGRFYAPDPAHQYASLYEYVGNNPINLVDPTGTFSITSFLGKELLKNVIIGAVLGASSGVLSAGLVAVHDKTTDFSLLASSLFNGALTGAIAGGIGSGVGLLLDVGITKLYLMGGSALGRGFTKGQIRGWGALKGAITGSVSGAVSQAVSNLVGTAYSAGFDWGSSMGLAVGFGFLGGVISGPFGATRMRVGKYYIESDAQAHQSGSYKVRFDNDYHISQPGRDWWSMVEDTIGERWSPRLGATLGLLGGLGSTGITEWAIPQNNQSQPAGTREIER